MKRRAPHMPKQPQWLVLTAVLAVLSVGAYLGSTWFGPWRPGRMAGLVFGWLAVALFVNAALYPTRKPGAWPWGTAQRWLQLHIYGSTLASLFVLIHAGWQIPSGLMGWSLLLLSVWTTASGLAGVALQKWVPAALADNLGPDVLAPRIPELTKALLEEADALAAATSTMVSTKYRSGIRPVLEQSNSNWRLGSQGAAAIPFRTIREMQIVATSADAESIMALETIVQDKLALDTHRGLQRLLRVWLVFHVPPAIALLGLVTVHVLAVLLY